jgi:hypothetical protein
MEKKNKVWPPLLVLSIGATETKQFFHSAEEKTGVSQCTARFAPS